MNIIVSPIDSDSYYFRSDSTFIRTISDYYIPDSVQKLSAVPVLCFRLGRAGKAVREKFAGRYFGPFTYGILLKPELKGEEDGYLRFMENSMDYSTIVPQNLTELEKYIGFLSEENPLRMEINGTEKFRMDKNPPFSRLYPKLSAITALCSIRTGDFLAYELAGPIGLSPEEHIIFSQREEKYIDLIIR